MWLNFEQNCVSRRQFAASDLFSLFAAVAAAAAATPWPSFSLRDQLPARFGAEPWVTAAGGLKFGQASWGKKKERDEDLAKCNSCVRVILSEKRFQDSDRSAYHRLAGPPGRRLCCLYVPEGASCQIHKHSITPSICLVDFSIRQFARKMSERPAVSTQGILENNL